VFTDLENYVCEPTDEGVIASLKHKSTGKNKIEMKIEAQQLCLKKDTRRRDKLRVWKKHLWISAGSFSRVSLL